MKSKITCIILITILLTTSIGSISSTSLTLKNINVTSQKGNWTVMVYFCGDNNLEYCCIEDFLNIAKTGSSEDVNFVVQIDRMNPKNLTYNLKNYESDDKRFGNWENCQRFHITKNMTPTIENASKDWGDGKGGREINMGEPEVLQDFVNWSVKNYPAEKYFLILFDHGAGLNGTCFDGFDGKNKKIDGIEILKKSGEQKGELASAMENISNRFGESDFLLGIQACNMARIEIMHEIKDYADYLISAENYDAYPLWNYTLIANRLVKNSNMSQEELGTLVVKNHPSAGLNTPYPLNLVDLSKIDSIVQSFNYLLDFIIDADSIFMPEVVSSIDSYHLDRYPLTSKKPQQSVRRGKEKISDLCWFLSNLEKFHNGHEGAYNETLSGFLTVVQRNIKEAIIADNDPNDSSCGFAIYMPDFDDKSCEYANNNLSFLNESKWDEFLLWYVNYKENKPPSTVVVQIDELYLSYGHDPDDDDVLYKFKNDLDEESEWVSSIRKSGIKLIGRKIKGKTRDEHGLESVWSEFYSKEKSKQKRDINEYPILNLINKLMNFSFFKFISRIIKKQIFF